MITAHASERSGISVEKFMDWADPAEVFSRLYGHRSHAIWLDNGPHADSGVSYLAAAEARSEFVTADARAGSVTISKPMDPSTRPRTESGTIFDLIKSRTTPQAGPAEHGPSFRLGWVGWFGYGLSRQTIGVQLPAGSAEELPDAAFLFVDRALAFDHASRTITLLAMESLDPGEIRQWTSQVRAAIGSAQEHGCSGRERGPRPAIPERAAMVPQGSFTWRFEANRYAELIESCQEDIVAGNAYVLCLTNELRSSVKPDPLTVFLNLRAANPSHHAALLRFGTHSVISASPEQFLLVDAAGRIRTKPIKGTRARGHDTESDRALADELRNDDKERAENIMIVDLMRNDLSKVARLGSVTTSALLKIESYSNVHQLVSTVDACRADGVSTADVIEACFPPGSMTGTPKRSAVSILGDLEQGGRGAYSGAFGYIGVDGAADLAVTIRTIVIGPHGTGIGTGGGITILSQSAAEINELWLKAQPLVAVVEQSLDC
jgi:para-aminobenzoate synthetase component 1